MISPALATNEVERFRRAIGQRTGLSFDASREEFLRELLLRRVRESGAQEVSAYLARLEATPLGREEVSALSEQLTVPETYFFRNADHFAVLLEVALPERSRAREHERSLRILSAGCASGEEAYSLAMLLMEQTNTRPGATHVPALAGWDVSILGIDLCPASLRRARKGSYSAWALRATPPDVRSRYFRASGSEHVLSEQVRNRVRFEERNLVEDDPAFWQPGVFDVVFCRNVMMYFEPHLMRAVTSRIATSLAPGGFLFLGHAENLRGVSDDFELRHTHETFYYQRRGGAVRSLPPVEAVRTFRTDVPLPWFRAGEWVNEIEQASARIEKLARSSIVEQQPPPPPLPLPGTPPIGEALRLLEKERFADALEVLQRLPREDRDRPEAQLMYAVLLAHSGRHPEAEAVCRLLIPAESVSAMAHHLIALSREHAGDLRGAVEHEEAASRIDPRFAMPRLHLGRLAKRTHDMAGARRELGRALTLLPLEGDERILLFGGGFTREALTRLCRAELQSVGKVR